MGCFAALQEGGVVFFVHAGIQMQPSARDAGVHGIYADAFGREFQCSAARQLIDGGFADAIGEILTAAPLKDVPPLPFSNYI